MVNKAKHDVLSEEVSLKHLFNYREAELLIPKDYVLTVIIYDASILCKVPTG